VRALLLLISMVMLSAHVSASPIPILLLTQQQTPYSEQLPDGSQQGLALQTIRCALQRSGQTSLIRFVSWSRAQRLVESGEADGYFPASRNPQRDERALWIGPAAQQQWRWYLRRDSRLDPAAPEFIQQARVGAYAGSNMHQWLLDHGYRISVSPPGHDQMLDVLLAGRADAVLAANLAMEALIVARGAEQRVRSVLLQDKPLGLYLARHFLLRQPQLAEQLQQQMQRCYQLAN